MLNSLCDFFFKILEGKFATSNMKPAIVKPSIARFSWFIS